MIPSLTDRRHLRNQYRPATEQAMLLYKGTCLETGTYSLMNYKRNEYIRQGYSEKELKVKKYKG